MHVPPSPVQRDSKFYEEKHRTLLVLQCFPKANNVTCSSDSSEAIQFFGSFRVFGESQSWTQKKAELPQVRIRRHSVSQNLTEMPPLTERRPVLSWVRTSPFSTVA